jgi:transcriptional regulator with XRE-family HTH domain
VRAAQQGCWTPQDRDVLKAVGALVRRARKARGHSIANAAKLVGLDPSYFGELERRRANVSVTALAALGRTLGVPVRDLVPDEEALRALQDGVDPEAVE